MSYKPLCQKIKRARNPCARNKKGIMKGTIFDFTILDVESPWVQVES